MRVKIFILTDWEIRKDVTAFWNVDFIFCIYLEAAEKTAIQNTTKEKWNFKKWNQNKKWNNNKKKYNFYSQLRFEYYYMDYRNRIFIVTRHCYYISEKKLCLFVYISCICICVYCYEYMWFMKPFALCRFPLAAVITI